MHCTFDNKIIKGSGYLNVNPLFPTECCKISKYHEVHEMDFILKTKHKITVLSRDHTHSIKDVELPTKFSF